MSKFKDPTLRKKLREARASYQKKRRFPSNRFSPLNFKLGIKLFGQNSLGYKNWHKAVLKRDHYKCLFCGSSKNLHVHHIDRWGTFVKGRVNLNNGQTLCRVCHTKLHPWLNDNKYNTNKKKGGSA